MTMTTIVVYADETDPDVRLAWRDLAGVLRNFIGWTLRCEVINRAANTIAFNKTTGVTGGDGTGLSNVNIAFTGSELTPLVSPIAYALRTVAVNGAETAIFTLDPSGALPRLLVVAKPVPA
jgi:hypothetical protein